ncbi:MAG: hypothetical protein AMXMBFR33_29260 [Candidatus Xenobia bacterium]
MDRVSLWAGVPCSRLASSGYLMAANEGDAVAMAAGAWLGGAQGGVLMQSSGLGNAVNPLTSLVVPFAIPVLLVVSVRTDEPQHELMGALTRPMLEQMGIACSGEAAPVLASRRSFAVLQLSGAAGSGGSAFAGAAGSGGSAFAGAAGSGGSAFAGAAGSGGSAFAGAAGSGSGLEPVASRRAMLAAVQSCTSASDRLIATTGYTGRELYALEDRANQFSMAGSMGCALSLGLGLALTRPELRVLVLDGDGALLMRLGSLATAGMLRPPNLVHVLLDNRCHDSTGGQPTASAGMDWCALASACGYPEVTRLSRPEELVGWLAGGPGLRFAHVPILAGTPAGLPRPALPMPEQALRFREGA